MIKYERERDRIITDNNIRSITSQSLTKELFSLLDSSHYNKNNVTYSDILNVTEDTLTSDQINILTEVISWYYESVYNSKSGEIKRNYPEIDNLLFTD